MAAPLRLTLAQQQQAQQYLPLARSIARSFARDYPHLAEDLVSEATLVLSRKAAYWTPDRGVHFAVYARPGIWGACVSLIRREAKHAAASGVGDLLSAVADQPQSEASDYVYGEGHEAYEAYEVCEDDDMTPAESSRRLARAKIELAAAEDLEKISRASLKKAKLDRDKAKALIEFLAGEAGDNGASE